MTPALGAVHDALQPAGPQAARIAELWWLTLAVCGVVFVAVLAAFLYSLWKAPRADAATPADVSSLASAEPRARRTVIFAVTIAIAGLALLLVASVMTDRALAGLDVQDALHIEVTAHQWWWDVRYDDPEPSRAFTTANEIHVPVGRPVIVSLASADVIHSFWVPNIHGKKDLIPGYTTTTQFRVDQQGVYRGQCAEFCGLQHALMAFIVIAEPRDQFEAWAEAQRKPAPEPVGGDAKRGRDLFLSGPCMMCHAIAGTPASAHNAPDLTHFASRRTLAAGTLANTPSDLAAWILDPQKIKPGANMPAHPLVQADLQALVAYLETLQ